MNYEEALNFIHGTLKFGSKLGLHNITALLELMGNPHRKLKFVHVAGTNGKGSTVAFISQILMEAGYRVGIYTSPYLERFTERMKVNDREIAPDELASITEWVKGKIEILLERGEAHPTEFEIVTAIAFEYYLRKQCDIVVLEVGLGGRFDSTNVIDTPEAAVITTISYDHMDILGDTLEKIAYEKAGIIKTGGQVVLYPQRPEVEAVFRQVCNERKATLHKVDLNTLQIRSFGENGQDFNFEDYRDLHIGLLGVHQAGNAAVGVKTMGLLAEKGFNIKEKDIRAGLASTKWPGRFELLCRSPLLVIDGAHNREGAIALAGNLQKYFPGRRITFIIGVLRDKDYTGMIEAVAPIASRFVAVTPFSPRALPARELVNVLGNYCKNVENRDTIEDAVRTCMEQAGESDLICAFGSLYYIGEVRKIFNIV